MSSQEYFITFVFLFLFLAWIGAISWLMVGGATKCSQDNTKSGILSFVLAIVVMIAGITSWYHVSNQPGWEFLKTPTCTECSKPITSEDNFCSHCGAEIKLEFECENCKSEYEAGDKYCSECGTAIPQEDEPDA